ncbi:hypothetical protein [Paracoccus mutanolyticus]|uniref:hypothetical protein n=1 Tax=Paracoccus mutanolyticus TaxID=1499308 RepID=UPI0029500544|nr:hypothetical protein [Paracoccus mutanolyticus]
MDQVHEGKVAGEWLVKDVGDKPCKVVELQGTTGSSPAIGARMDAEGFVHDGTIITAHGTTVHIDFKALVNKSVMIYGQTEVTQDLYTELDRIGARSFTPGRRPEALGGLVMMSWANCSRARPRDLLFEAIQYGEKDDVKDGCSSGRWRRGSTAPSRPAGTRALTTTPCPPRGCRNSGGDGTRCAQRRQTHHLQNSTPTHPAPRRQSGPAPDSARRCRSPGPAGDPRA